MGGQVVPIDRKVMGGLLLWLAQSEHWCSSVHGAQELFIPLLALTAKGKGSNQKESSSWAH
jgi:hypothetical protein